MKNSTLLVVECFLFIVLHSDKLVTVHASPTCKWNQITRMNGSSKSCWDCPTCRLGRGLIPQCSSYVSVDVPIQCEDCKQGISYSDVDDISSCKPCTICGDNEITIRPCNTTHNAICGKCKPGFYRSITEDCWPCTKCCPDSTADDVEPQCLKQGLPAKYSCRLDFKTQECANQPTPNSISSEDMMMYRNGSGDGRGGMKNVTIIKQYHIIHKYDQRIWIFIGAGIFFCILVGVFFYVCRNCRQPMKKSLIRQEEGYNYSQPTAV